MLAAKDPARLIEEWENICPTVIKPDAISVYMNSRACREREADEAIEALEKADCFAITIDSDDYPESLKAIPLPPLVLYGKGNRALLKKRKFCIVGSRVTPAWAEKQAKLFSEELSKHFAIVTGFAEGGDRAAIDGAIKSGNLICVLPLGLDLCYPAGHASLKTQVAKRGLLLSEYPLGTRLQKHHFYARNSILAGLSEGVLIVSGRVKRSGALITANRANEYGRDVFAFPYSLGVEAGGGCNELIKEGSFLATDVSDVFFRYGIKLEERAPQTLSKEEEILYRLLREGGELHVTQLAEKSGLPVYEIAAHLSSLEMKNLAVKAGGNRYSAV